MRDLDFEFTQQIKSHNKYISIYTEDKRIFQLITNYNHFALVLRWFPYIRFLGTLWMKPTSSEVKQELVFRGLGAVLHNEYDELMLAACN